jgi:predicted PurR-regulated permease PerM
MSITRKWSLLILLGTVVGIGVVFFRVIWPFLFPLLFASVLAILFRPIHEWACRMCFGRRRLAAVLTTLGVILIVLLPLSGVLILAGVELIEAGKSLVETIDLPRNANDARRWIDPEQHPRMASWLEAVETRLSVEELEQVSELISSALLGATQSLYKRTLGLAADVITFVIGLVVMLVALYYLFADGDKLANEVQRLSPLEAEDGLELFGKFESVCRGVVISNVVAAVVQGVLAGIGFALVGAEKIWLLTILTMFFSLIPFLGAAMVWIVIALGLVVEQRFGAAIFLTIYGTIIVSTSDNVIKAYVIGEQAKMHPFVVLVTVLGALQLVGLWGIFVGPMIASFFHALLNILRNRLLEDSGQIVRSPELPGPV